MEKKKYLLVLIGKKSKRLHDAFCGIDTVVFTNEVVIMTMASFINYPHRKTIYGKTRTGRRTTILLTETGWHLVIYVDGVWGVAVRLFRFRFLYIKYKQLQWMSDYNEKKTPRHPLGNAGG
ncbi:MAG: hypothetical protein FWE67_03950 [Planctomycetaceae bacterium]|nr:hypothetical protein [Planctomycetaceae bacterium]